MGRKISLVALLIGLGVWLVSMPTASAKPLVSLDTEGKPLPGAVVQWNQERFDSVTLVLEEPKAKEVAAILARKLPQGEAFTVTSQMVRITGIPVGALYHLLAAIDLDDPESPEAFLRSFPQPAQTSASGTPDAIKALLRSGVLPHRDRWTATVLDVQRAEFPLTEVRVVLRRVPEQGGASVVGLVSGKEVVLVPLIALKAKKDPLVANLADPLSMMNAGAYYLRPGDEVTFHIGGVYKGKLLAAQLVRTEAALSVVPTAVPEPKAKKPAGTATQP